jgi:hypothetical protein
MRNFRQLRLSVAVAAAITLIAACGGGSDSATTPTPVIPVTGSATGILSDSLIQGVSYVTSSGVKGTTNAAGEYKFNPGDTVEFTLGGLSLGSVVATGIVTPIELAKNDAVKLQNLLVLLQSLDTDSNPANGIQISASTAAAIAGDSINLAQNNALFASVANVGLLKAMVAGGINSLVKTPEQANAHFLAEANNLLSSNIWVSLPDANDTHNTVAIRFGANGQYIHGEAGLTADGGQSGVEAGTAVASLFDINGFKLLASQTLDTNKEWGLSLPHACDRLRPVGDKIVVTYENGTGGCSSNAMLSKAENDPSGIVGAWSISPSEIKTQWFVFFANGKYMMIDPIGDLATAGHPSCGGPGVEYGNYSYDKLTKVFKISTPLYDTNGCAGLSQSGAEKTAGISFTIATDGKTASLGTTDGIATLTRISH